MRIRFSGSVTVFHDRRLPEAATPAGYAALIDAYHLSVPVPRVLSAIGTKHRIIEQGGWRIYTPRHAPDATLEGHLTFALKYEGLDLGILKRLFLAVNEREITDLVRKKPTGLYTCSTRAASGFSMNGCWSANSICLRQTKSLTSTPSILNSNTPAPGRIRRGTASAIICQAHRISVRSFSRRQH